MPGQQQPSINDHFKAESAAGPKWYVGVFAGAIVFMSIAVAVWLLWPVTSEPRPWQVRPLTAYRGSEVCPAFSPDGSQIAFSWDGDTPGNFDVYVQRLDSGSPVRLTSSPALDVSPAWSPDGHSIAFVRLGPFGGNDALMIVSVTGQPERKLTDVLVTYDQSGMHPRLLDWSQDGKGIAVGGQTLAPDRSGIVVVSIGSGEKHTIVAPPAGPAFDTTPAFSPDGTRLAFTRCQNYSTCDLYALDLSVRNAEPRRLTFGDYNVSSPVWSVDGREILVSAGALWESRSVLRIAVSGERRVREPLAAPDVQALTMSARGALVYSRELFDVDLWMIEMAKPATKPGVPKRVITSTRMEFSPDLSPDGRRIAFVSNRSGNPEIWVADRGGSNAVQLTKSGLRQANRPRWAPDGERLAYALSGEGTSTVCVIRTTGGAARCLTSGQQLDTLPNWSRDGNWVYFLSRRSGSRELWKVPAGGESIGPAIQITKKGAGSEAFESYDGRVVYYSGIPRGVFMMPAGGGNEASVPDLETHGAIALCREGIYMLSWPEIGHSASLLFLRYGGRAAQTVATVQDPYGTITASADGRTVLYSKVERRESDLMLAENFR